MKKFFTGATLIVTCVLNAQWDTLNTGYNLRYEGIDFKDANNGVVVGNEIGGSGNGYVLITTDGGATWGNPLAFQLERHDVDYAPSGSYWIVGDSGRVIYTGWPTSGYIFQGNITTDNLRCGFPVNDSVYYCAGENGSLFLTSNRGVSWDTLNSGTILTINDIYFVDAANGWIVGDGGYVAATADSGATWQLVETGLFGFYDFNSFAYQGPSASYPYLVGEDGNGLFSTNGGAQWWGFATGTTLGLNRIRFMNTMSGIICGNDGYIYRSEDGGGTWFNDPSDEAVDLYDIAFAGDTTAFICGDSGVVLRSRTDISSVTHPSTPGFGAKLYPNPFSGPLFASMLLKQESDVTIEVIDLAGRTVSTDYYFNVNAGEQQFEIETSNITPGAYFVRIMTGYGSVTIPVIKH